MCALRTALDVRPGAQALKSEAQKWCQRHRDENLFKALARGPGFRERRQRAVTGKLVNSSVAGSFTSPGTQVAHDIHAVVFRKQKMVFGYLLGETESGAITITPDDHPLVP